MSISFYIYISIIDMEIPNVDIDLKIYIYRYLPGRKPQYWSDVHHREQLSGTTLYRLWCIYMHTSWNFNKQQ